MTCEGCEGCGCEGWEWGRGTGNGRNRVNWLRLRKVSVAVGVVWLESRCSQSGLDCSLVSAWGRQRLCEVCFGEVWGVWDVTSVWCVEGDLLLLMGQSGWS